MMAVHLSKEVVGRAHVIKANVVTFTAGLIVVALLARLDLHFSRGLYL